MTFIGDSHRGGEEVSPRIVRLVSTDWASKRARTSTGTTEEDITMGFKKFIADLAAGYRKLTVYDAGRKAGHDADRTEED